jgi:ATP-dependent Clp protease adaptor protein ClpS
LSDTPNDPRRGAALKERGETEIQEPPMYQVVLLNDDYTTQDFVVEVLELVFRKDQAEATRIMLDVHRLGAGMVGVYTWDIASTKVEEVHRMARDRGYPLRCRIEEA